MSLDFSEKPSAGRACVMREVRILISVFPKTFFGVSARVQTD